VSLPELLHLGEELRALFAEERAAIGALDHETLDRIADTKRTLVERLAVLRDELAGEQSAAVRDVFAAIRTEAHATALLAAAANAAVRAVLGYDTANAYDRRARRAEATPSRILAAL
jgi:hypothetical protein